MNNTFRGNMNLKRISLPKTLVDMEYALYDAESLESIVIPQSVQRISALEFANANLLYAIVLPEVPPTFHNGYYNPFDKIYDTTHKIKKYKIYVPDNSYAEYAKSRLWSDYEKVGRLAKLSQFRTDFPNESYFESEF